MNDQPTPTTPRKTMPRFGLILAIGSFAILGLFALRAIFGAGETVSLQAEGAVDAGATTGNVVKQDDNTVSGGSYLLFGPNENNNGNNGGGGQTVSIPTNPSPAAQAISGGKTRGEVACASTSSVCAFAWADGDLYIGTRNGAFDSYVEWIDISTGQSIKRVTVTDLPGAPTNAARLFPVHNPLKDEWYVAYHATRLGGPSSNNEASTYGVLFDNQGNNLTDVVELYDGDWTGWMPNGVFDTVSKQYYFEWHQQTGNDIDGYAGIKDMVGVIVAEDGSVVKSGTDHTNTPDLLEEYSDTEFNTNTNELISIYSKSSGVCGESCLTVLAMRTFGLSSDLVLAGDELILDEDEQWEWGVNVSHNPSTDRYFLGYREGGDVLKNTGSSTIKGRILGDGGAQVGDEITISTAGGGYWQTGSACSTKTNLCMSTFGGSAAYIDTATGESGNAFDAGVGAFNLPSSKVAYSPSEEVFVFFGGNGYSTIADR